MGLVKFLSAGEKKRGSLNGYFVLHANPRNTTVTSDNHAFYVQVYPDEFRFVRFNADGSYYDRQGHNESSIACEGKAIDQLRKESRTYQFLQR